MNTRIKRITFAALILMAGVMMSACHQRDFTEDVVERTSTHQLRILTRGVGDEGEISWPVTVYVFHAGSCQVVQNLSSASDELNVKLNEGQYEVFAIAGADTAIYQLPTEDDAATESIVALKDGQMHADLMTARAAVTLSEGGENAVTLSLERKVLQIQEVVIKNVPTTATEVTVAISPLWEKLTMDGSYVGENGSQTLSLVKQADGRTWKNASTLYILPSVGKPMLKVSIVKEGKTTEYTYSCVEVLEANSKLSFEGTCTETSEVTLTGTLEGVRWGDNRTIQFEFGANASGNTSAPATSIEAGSIYKGCYVLSVSSNQVTLLSPNEMMGPFAKNDDDATRQSKLQTQLQNCGVTGVDGWRVMTTAEAQLLYENFATINAVLSANRINAVRSGVDYMVNDAGELKKAELSATSFTLQSSPDSYTYLRPVAVVTVE